jgi:hypothetical protein
VTNIHNFPHNRGLVVGLGKAFNGLGASVFGLVYSGIFAPSAVSYLLFIAIGPTLISWCALYAAQRVPEVCCFVDLLFSVCCFRSAVSADSVVVSSQTERMSPVDVKSLHLGYYTTIALACFMASVALADAYATLPRPLRAVLVACLVLFYLPYAYMPFKARNALQYACLEDTARGGALQASTSGISEAKTPVRCNPTQPVLLLLACCCFCFRRDLQNP